MKRSKQDIVLLIAELEADLLSLQELETTNQRAEKRISAGANDDLDYAALGYTLHNISNLVGNSFYRIAKYFENNLECHSWHKDLIQRMTLSLEGIRPAVLDAATAEKLDELRSFRHVFRNMYRKRIDPGKIMTIQATLPGTISDYTQKILSSIQLLREVLE